MNERELVRLRTVSGRIRRQRERDRILQLMKAEIIARGFIVKQGRRRQRLQVFDLLGEPIDLTEK